VRDARVWHALLGVEKTVIEDVEFDELDQVLVVRVRPARGATRRCGVCRRRCARYDTGEGRRRWRALDLGTVQAVLEADAPRVSCREHGVVVAHVPWARHSAGHTCAFDDTVAWLATQTSKSAVVELMRIAWRTVGSIIARVWADTETLHDRFAGLRRLGIDEISYKRGHRYLTMVIDHDSGRLVWAAPGRDMATLQTFFDRLGPERCALITHVSADAAEFIAKVVAKNCPSAVRCADPFHVVRWATDALDEVRRQAWNDARRLARETEAKRGPGRPSADAPARPASARARGLKGVRYVLWKNPENLTGETARQTRLDRPDRPPAAPRLPAQRGSPVDLPDAHRAGPRGVGPVGRLGPPMPDPGVRETAEKHRRAHPVDPGRGRARPVQRPHRIGQHQDPAHHPHRLRLQIPRRPRRTGHAQPRRPPPRATPPEMRE